MNKKKLVALVMATSMVLGSSITAFAAETSGSINAAGELEGSVEEKLINVVLPTVPDGSAPFDYVMDPEGLIAETEGGKYDGYTFPTDSDTGVYFLTADKTYTNESNVLNVVNQSSHPVELTVKAEVTSAETDIALAAKDALATAEEASLYLGVVVGTEDAVAVSKEAAVEKTVTLAGTPGNFKVDVKSDKSGYEYRALTLAEYKALDGNAAKEAIEWVSTAIKMEGAVTTGKSVTAEVTAPTVKVTWSWVDPSAEDEETEEPETPVEPESVDAYVEYVDNSWWIAPSSDEKFSDEAVLGTVTINDTEVNASLQDYDGGKWVVITWDAYVDAGLDQAVTTYDIEAVVDGTTYKVTHVYE